MKNRTTFSKLLSFWQNSFAGSLFFFTLFSISCAISVHASDGAAESITESITDLRVLVDISGSMKNTDPDNLRRPAVRLLAGLIPAGSRAGIWNFGKQVNMTVKIGTVDDTWREQARSASKNINSVGLYTNIEQALRKVSFDWKKDDPRYKRNLILLTDGHVDVSEDNKLDMSSRERIIKEILPSLEKAKVRIHTIALSDNVDESLLTTLSSYTNGLYQKVTSADDLQKLFLQMLEQSVKMDTLPLADNRFNVDDSIDDMTLLVFNKDKAHPTTIVTPGKRTWSAQEKPNEVEWFNDEGYDLITIKKPQQGQWKIMSPADDNNRVVVATNLKLKLNDLPSYAMLGDIINVTAQLFEDGKPLTDQRLLSKFKFTLTRTETGAKELQFPMQKLSADTTTYSVQLPPIFKPGDNSLVIQAKSPTAEREINHKFTVYSVPAKVKITEEQDDFKLTVTPHESLLRPESIKITAIVDDKNKFILVPHNKNWSLYIDKKYKNKIFTLNIEAIRADGKTMSVNFNKVLAASDKPQALVLQVKEPVQNVKEKVTEHKRELQHAAGEKSNNKKTSEKEKNNDAAEINWTVIIISIVAVNMFIIVLLGGGYVYIKRRKAKMTESLTDEMNEDNVTKDEKINVDNPKDGKFDE